MLTQKGIQLKNTNTLNYSYIIKLLIYNILYIHIRILKDDKSKLIIVSFFTINF